MNNSPLLIKKAKKRVARHVISSAVLSVLLIAAYVAISMTDFPYAALIALAIFVPIVGVCGTLLFKVNILSILHRDLDPALFLEVMRRGKLHRPDAMWQIYGEYFHGSYRNAVAVCKMMLSDPKCSKNSKYSYMGYLANVYFDLGDRDALRDICEKFNSALAAEKPARAKKIAASFPRVTFSDLYLKNDIPACAEWIGRPIETKLAKYNRIFCRARLAELSGNTAEARSCYETLISEVPELNYGKLAQKRLCELDGIPVEGKFDTFDLSVPTDATIISPERHKLRKAIFTVLFAISVIVCIVGAYRAANSDKIYREEIRVMVEEDHDGVEVLDTFTLKAGDDIVDTMFICRTDEDLIVGCTYVYDGDPKSYYDVLTSLPISTVTESTSPITYCDFFALTSPYFVDCSLYNSEAALPNEYCHLSTLEIDGQKIFFVVNRIVSE